MEGKRFRKRPVVISAMQYDGTSDGCERVHMWMRYKRIYDITHRETTLGHILIIPTPEGNIRASPGDWIVCGIRGEYYPVKPDIFTATYEEITE